jgi:hypothetical protein
MAENMSAYLATCAADFLDSPGFMFRYLQKYRQNVKGALPLAVTSVARARSGKLTLLIFSARRSLESNLPGRDR